MIGDILQPTHLLFLLIVALVVLGPKRLPEMAKTLGNGLRDFRSAMNGEHHEPDTIAEPERQPIASDHPSDGIAEPETQPIANGHQSGGTAEPGSQPIANGSDGSTSNDADGVPAFGDEPAGADLASTSNSDPVLKATVEPDAADAPQSAPAPEPAAEHRT